jgi:hypothetical protein
VRRVRATVILLHRSGGTYVCAPRYVCAKYPIKPDGYFGPARILVGGQMGRLVIYFHPTFVR